ncbi:imidazolonepropionase [bacterium]|nr:imidazolonepropionase [bacterium]
MSYRLILTDIAEIFTAERDNLILTGGALLIAVDSAGIIIFVGKESDFEKDEPAFRQRYHHLVISAQNRIVYPGLIDAHTHILYAQTREDEYEKKARGVSYEQIAAEGGGILNSAEKTVLASFDDLYRESEKRLLQMISYGITTVEMKSGYALTPDGEIRLLQVADALRKKYPVTILSTFLGAHAYPVEFKENHTGYIDLLINEMLPRVKEETEASFVDVFCEKGYFSVAETERIFTAAKELGFGLKLHADEFNALGGTELAAQYGALSVDHLEAVTEQGIDAMKAAGVTPVVLPITSVFSRLPYAPAQKMIEAGLPVAFATDFNPGSSMSGFLPLAASLASTQLGVSVQDALLGITTHAAHAVGLGESHGKIVKGYQGDIVVMDAQSWMYPLYHMAHNHAWKIFIKGEQVDTTAQIELNGAECDERGATHATD